MACSDLTTIVALYEDSHLVGFATMGMSNSTTAGCIISFFFRPKPNVSVTPDQLITNFIIEDWLTSNTMPVTNVGHDGGVTILTDNTTQSVNYIIGDINNDGYITVNDAQILYNLIEQYGVFSVDFTGAYTNTYNGINGYYLINVGDVNGDGFLDNNDVSAILSYYTIYIVNGAPLSGYNGTIGTGAYVILMDFASF